MINKSSLSRFRRGEEKTDKSNSRGRRAVLIRLSELLRGQYAAVLLSVLFAFLSSSIQLILPILTGSAIDMLADGGGVDWEGLRSILMLMAVLIVGASVFNLIMSRINLRISYRMSEQLRNRLFIHIGRLPFSKLDNIKDGDMLQRLTVDIDQLSDGMIMSFNQLFSGVISIVATLVLMFKINAVTAAVVVLLTPLSFAAAALVTKKSYRLFRKQAEDKAGLSGLMDEMITELRTVKTFSYEDRALDRFEKLNNELAGSYTSSVFISSVTNPLTRFINALIYAVVAVTGAVFVIKGRLSVGGLTAFLSYASQYSKPFNEISGVFAEMQNALASAARVFEILDMEPEYEAAVTESLPAQVKGDIDIVDMSFSYTEDRPLIEHMSLSVKHGQRVAIVGPTGSGKSTLINLLMRFYDPVGGRIYLDGVPTDSVSRAELRESFAMVLQDTWLKNASIYENIAYGSRSADREAVIAAAKEAHAHSFIKRLKHGYDEIVSNEGNSLSQGERQLICIARAMLRNAPVLLLDEATSSIDTRTERRVQKAFLKLMEGRTSFIVAHRLSTIVDSDLIIVMDNGNIAEIGNHAELMAKKDYYYRLYMSQFDDGNGGQDDKKE